VLESLGQEDLIRYEELARRAVDRHRGRMDDDALDDAKARFIVHRARAALGLPRVSLV
jgi:hypothetical protein